MTKPDLPPVVDLLRGLVANHSVLSHADCPFSYYFQPGWEQVAVLAGDNATGKSFLMGAAGSRAYYDHGIEPMIVSMTARTSEGMMRVFSYGRENGRATGEVSTRVAFSALGAIPDRLKIQRNALVVLDEPDVGLAEGFAYAFGQMLGQRINELEGNQWGVLLVSHSRELVRGLNDTLRARPSFAHTQTPKTLDEWVNDTPRYSAEALEQMFENARERSTQVRQIQQPKA